MVNEEDDFPDEDEFEEAPAPAPVRVETRGRPPKREVAQVQPKREQKPEDDAYGAFSITARNGIVNKATNEIVGEDILTILAKMLSKIEKIERATC